MAQPASVKPLVLHIKENKMKFLKYFNKMQQIVLLVIKKGNINPFNESFLHL